MLNPATPGVSVEEITKLPYSVAYIETAMPAFIGYTELLPVGYNEPFTISSLLEYEQYFGKAKEENIQLQDVEGKGATIIAPQAQFLMYYSLQMYFANGGGPCYIISVGDYTSAQVQLSSLEAGLAKIDHKNIKEPILIIFPDAVSLTNESEFYSIYNQAIDKAKVENKNRFVILDTYYGNSVVQSNNLTTIESFRSKVNPTNHAAAYFPHLKTILNYTFDETKTPIVHTGLQKAGQGSALFYAGEIAALDELKRLASAEISTGSADAYVLADLLDQAIVIAEEVNEAADAGDKKNALTEVINEAKVVLEAIYEGIIDDFKIPDDLDENAPVFSGEFDALKTAILEVKDEKGDANGITLKNLELSNSALYNQVKKEIQSLKVVLPPSSAIAGAYGRIDSTRGVWKAPANINISHVTTPTEKISDQEQAALNIDAFGKSINAIRTFTGKGTLIWGARTLEGKDKNDEGKDNEWKYVHVRRYYNMIRQSINDALNKFMNEPNIPHTWLRAKTMLENFLNQQWMEGALAGSTPKEAYEVTVKGVEGTTTMNVNLKIALVRPAEFIVLNFSHKLQQF
ncbi:phage tail sheath family protein [Chryseobacterium viscerum]|uniref:phage tail sheath family protein n=1 Tax=Chryseobacterium viscerum TaxID=1037377 RepID=UPI0022238EE5|nr:phage tail sheath C-terminal domain-containing protein [Chryseobacterium viscerum]MCW1961449.1 phage tail sheath subtilisin-like domain-containing protein [Chryseobacterium viscerum]